MLTPMQAAIEACGETAPKWLLNSVAHAIEMARADGLEHAPDDPGSGDQLVAALELLGISDAVWDDKC